MNRDPYAEPEHPMGAGGHAGHSWMMIACCVPMLIIAIALVAIGAVSPGFLLAAVGCLAMMWFMMRVMSGSGGDTHHSGRS